MSLRKPSFESESESSEINISPLIDVMFILLIFFVVTMVFSEKSALDIERPKAETAERPGEDALNIFIDRRGGITFEGRSVTLDALRPMLDSSGKGAAVIDADGGLGLSRLVEVMDACRECGISRIFIAADRKAVRE